MEINDASLYPGGEFHEFQLPGTSCFNSVLANLDVFLTAQTFCLAAKKDKQKDYVMTEIELQSELMSYADRFASIITQSFEDFDTLKPHPQARQFILSDLVYSSSI